MPLSFKVLNPAFVGRGIFLPELSLFLNLNFISADSDENDFSIHCKRSFYITFSSKKSQKYSLFLQKCDKMTI